MISKKCMVFCLLVLFAPSFAWAAEIFSLEKSIEYGLQHSPVLQGGEIQIDEADMDIKAQRGRFFPSVSTGYSYSEIINEYASGEANPSYNQLTKTYDSTFHDNNYSDQNSSTASLRMTQALFAGFENKNRFERAKLGKEYYKAQLRVKKLSLAYNIKGVFFELLKKKYDLSTITERLKRLESDLAAARAFSDNKMVPYVYVLQAEADLEDAKQTLWQTETAIYKNSSRLKSLLGIEREYGPVEFDDVFEVPVHKMAGDLDYYMDKALLTRPEFLLVSLQTDMAKKDAAIAQGRYYPRIDLDLGIYDSEKKYDDKNLSDKYNANNVYWRAGVSAQINLFDGGSAYYEKKKYLLEVKRLEKDKKQIQMEIGEEVSVALNSLKETRKRLVSVEKALAASRENYTRQKKSFNARIATISELLDAQAMLARAEAAKSQTLLDGQMFMSALFNAMGVEQTSFGQIRPDLDK